MLILSSCGQAGKTQLQPPARFKPPPVIDGETTVYEWTAPNDPSPTGGVRLMTVKRVNMTIPCFQLTIVDRFPESGPISRSRTDSTVVTFTREDLTPLHSLFYPAENDSLLWIAAVYEDRTARIITRTPEGDLENRLPTGALTFDLFQLPFLCRSLKLIATDIPLHILVITPTTSPPGGMSAIAEIGSGGVDTVITPAGKFACQRLIVRQPHLEEVYWIEKNGARKIIRYENRTTGRGLRLTATAVNP